MDFELDEYGRLVYSGESRLAGLPAIVGAGPIIPPFPAGYHEARSGKWPPLLHDLLKQFPDCWGCGRKAVTGHHEVPFHVDPTKELDPGNILMVCLPCHFVICHAGRWELVVVTARARLSANLLAVRAAERLLSAVRGE